MSTDIEYQAPPPLQTHLTFWQQPLVQDLLPLGTSLLLHLVVIVVGLLTWKTYQVMTQPVLREQVIIPEAAIIEGANIGGIPNPGLGGDPNLAAAQNVDRNITVADGWNEKRSQTLTTTLMEGGAAPDAADSVIGLGARSGIAGGAGLGLGGESGSGGPMAAFGPPGGGMGLGPKSPFMGISGNARKVIYICDASGSMIDKFPTLKAELSKSIEVLRPIQGFNIIFFREGGADPLSKTVLLQATPDIKRKAFEFIIASFTGPSSDPLASIDLAFQQKPELIYLLTDGEFDDNAAVTARLRKLNADNRVKINTILLLSSRQAADLVDSVQMAEHVLKDIAAANGGQFKLVRVGG